MPQITKSDCVEILKSKLRGNQNFQLKDFEVINFEELLGFHSNHASLKIRAIVDGVVKCYTFFMKSSADNIELNERYWKVLKQFYKEHVVMTKLMKTLQNFVTRKITADCYLSKVEKFMVLENLCDEGYEISRTNTMNVLLADQAIQSLANLHASSILYEENTGISIEEKFKEIAYESMFFEDDKHPTELLLYSVDRGVRAMCEKYFTHLNSDERNRVFSKIRQRTVEVQNHAKKYRKVVCHGDPWGNNFLFKYDNKGTPVEAILVDFGAQRFAPPAMDLMLFMNIGLPAIFRTKYKHQIKDNYYNHLKDILSANGLDVANILPYEDFMETCQIYEEFGICLRVYYSYVTRLPGKYLAKAAGSVDSFLGLMAHGNPELGIDAFQSDESYRQVFTEAIEDAFLYYNSPIRH